MEPLNPLKKRYIIKNLQNGKLLSSLCSDGLKDSEIDFANMFMNKKDAKEFMKKSCLRKNGGVFEIIKIYTF